MPSSSLLLRTDLLRNRGSRVTQHPPGTSCSSLGSRTSQAAAGQGGQGWAVYLHHQHLLPFVKHEGAYAHLVRRVGRQLVLGGRQPAGQHQVILLRHGGGRGCGVWGQSGMGQERGRVVVWRRHARHLQPRMHLDAGRQPGAPSQHGETQSRGQPRAQQSAPGWPAASARSPCSRAAVPGGTGWAARNRKRRSGSRRSMAQRVHAAQRTQVSAGAHVGHSRHPAELQLRHASPPQSLPRARRAAMRPTPQ